MRNLLGIAVVLFASLAGCGPSVSEVRMATYPAREASCSLEFRKADMTELSSPSGTWELVGHVVVGQLGNQDPLSDDYRAIVRPRACKMGGEAVAVLLNANSQGPMSSGTTIDYGVLRKRTSSSSAPQKF